MVVRQDVKLEDLVLVRITNAFPRDGLIESQWSNSGLFFRDTVHFSLNQIHGYIMGPGACNYAVLIPFERFLASVDQTRILNFMEHDTYHFGDVELPEGSLILADQRAYSDQPAGKAKVVPLDLYEDGDLSQSKMADAIISAISDIGRDTLPYDADVPGLAAELHLPHFNYDHVSHWSSQLEAPAQTIAYWILGDRKPIEDIILVVPGEYRELVEKRFEEVVSRHDRETMQRKILSYLATLVNSANYYENIGLIADGKINSGLAPGLTEESVKRFLNQMPREVPPSLVEHFTHNVPWQQVDQHRGEDVWKMYASLNDKPWPGARPLQPAVGPSILQKAKL